jgi:hypothetical protein
VFLAPWLLIGLLVFTPLIWLVRRRKRRSRGGGTTG